MTSFILRILFDRSFISYDFWELLLQEILDKINYLYIALRNAKNIRVFGPTCAREIACESCNYVTHVGSTRESGCRWKERVYIPDISSSRNVLDCCFISVRI